MRSGVECVTIPVKEIFPGGNEDLACHVRLMRKGDIPQVEEIDREAFSTLWPPPNYVRELNNRMAHYVVACQDAVLAGQAQTQPAVASSPSGLRMWLRRLFGGNSDHKSSRPTECILGFAGFWIMADEAHITNIAVRESHHRRGIGELLLISAIELAARLKARMVTLEVRASNSAAQSLYRKYGFVNVGVRRRYYTDNNEDGVIMSTEDISSLTFEAQLRQLKQAHARRWAGLLCYVSL